jgi:type IV pilus assembly protein PilM
VARKVVGLDIGTTAVRAAEVSVRRGQVVLERIGQAGLPGGAVVDGEVHDPAAVATAIKDLWRRTRISSRRVIIGVANQRVVVRLVDLPWMEPGELRSSLGFQAGDYLPIPVDQTELDYAVIGEHEASGGQRLLRVLLVAAQKEMLAGHLEAVREAGLRPEGIDLNPIALLGSLGPVAGFEEGAEALVDVGARVTNMVVHDNGVLRFVRIQLMGGEDVTSTLEQALEVDRDTAERTKLTASAGGEVDPEAGDLVAQRLEVFVEEVRGSLDFYRSQQDATPLGRVVVSGGGSLLGPLVERLQAVTGVPVERGRTLAGVRVGRLGSTPRPWPSWSRPSPCRSAWPCGRWPRWRGEPRGPSSRARPGSTCCPASWSRSGWSGASGPASAPASWSCWPRSVSGTCWRPSS